ncbi:MAG: hypothetical protein C5B57_09140 [Blastocatellia bacterium]|nr:MAG: hypothetical protein C5B57_09140 [Blastocatellia bacterium]
MLGGAPLVPLHKKGGFVQAYVSNELFSLLPMITYARDDEQRRIRVILAGSVTLPDLLAVVDRQASEGTWTYGLLYDLREIADPLSWSDTEALLAQVRRLTSAHGSRGPVAVVSRSAATVGTTLMYAHRAGDDLNIEVFWDPLDAERWLDRYMRL